jgi:hypothetical protein
VAYSWHTHRRNARYGLRQYASLFWRVPLKKEGDTMRVKWILVREENAKTVCEGTTLYDSKQKAMELAREANAGLREPGRSTVVYTVGEVHLEDEA